MLIPKIPLFCLTFGVIGDSIHIWFRRKSEPFLILGHLAAHQNDSDGRCVLTAKNRLIIQFTIGLAMLAATAFTGSVAENSIATTTVIPAETVANTANIPEIQKTVKDTTETTEKKTTKTTEEVIKDYFKDTPILIDVARCESQYRQFDQNGNIIRGVYNPDDVGVMQINEFYHAKTAKKLGYDLYSLEGNMAYAKYLYEKEGTAPWEYSSKCWGKNREVSLNQ